MSYFPAGYFAPSYFQPGPDAGRSTGGYLAPSYFAPSYFPAGPPADPLTARAGPGSYDPPSYFAPAYFAPNYFGSSAATAPGPAVGYFPAGYFPGSYFPGSYFPGGSDGPRPAELPDDGQGDGQQLTDGRALVWARDTLRASGLFAWVGKGSRAGPNRGSGSFPSAWLWPVAYSESDDVDPDQLVRTLKFAVSIACRAETDDEAQAQLDLLSNAAADLLTASGPPGSIPGLSGCESGLYDSPAFGSASPIDGQVGNGGGASVRLACTMAYLIQGRGGRATR